VPRDDGSPVPDGGRRRQGGNAVGDTVLLIQLVGEFVQRDVSGHPRYPRPARRLTPTTGSPHHGRHDSPRRGSVEPRLYLNQEGLLGRYVPWIHQHRAEPRIDPRIQMEQQHTRLPRRS